MTNSYSSLRKTLKVVIIHGLNNNPACFLPLLEHFKARGFATEFVVLPGHGEKREETRSYQIAFSQFCLRMKEIARGPYAVVASSQGALYLQLWLEKNPQNKPLRQVLLAPALYLRRQKVIELALLKLPAALVIKSFSPKPFRRYQSMKVWEYRTLLEGVATYQKLKGVLRIPTLLVIDPKDEVVDAGRLKEEVERRNPGFEVQLFPRPRLRKGLGQHHILFHPEYFTPEEWDRFSGELGSFLEAV